jgi:hypothetical protein
MDMDIILVFNNKESISVVPSELLRTGEQQLIHRAIELELTSISHCINVLQLREIKHHF